MDETGDRSAGAPPKSSGTPSSSTFHVRFYEEVRVWMAKLDAEERQSRGEPIPAEVQRLLGALIADSTVTGEVLDIYEAAGMPKPSLMDLGPDFITQTQEAENPHLAIEALRDLVAKESVKASGANVLRQQAFSDRIAELMRKYTNQQLTSAEVIAELIALAKDVVAEADRGKTFTPPLEWDELAFYDAVTLNESAVREMDASVLAQIARDLVASMRRDIKTDWTVVEGHYVSGYGDGSSAVHDAEPLTVLPGAMDEASPVIEAHPETAHRIERVLRLAEGFESAYGLELLASVHWIIRHEPEAADDPDLLVRRVQEWTPRKGRMFRREHILIAADALTEHGWLRTNATA